MTNVDLAGRPERTLVGHVLHLLIGVSVGLEKQRWMLEASR